MCKCSPYVLLYWDPLYWLSIIVCIVCATSSVQSLSFLAWPFFVFIMGNVSFGIYLYHRSMINLVLWLVSSFDLEPRHAQGKLCVAALACAIILLIARTSFYAFELPLGRTIRSLSFTSITTAAHSKISWSASKHHARALI